MLYPLSQSALAANIVLPVLATIAVIGRLIARRKKGKSLEIDEVLILVSLVVTLSVCASGIYAASINAYAIPITEITPDQYAQRSLLIWTDVILVQLVFGLIKISILLFYKRIFVTPWFRRTVNLCIWPIVAWVITAEFAHIFSHWPIDSFWLNPYAETTLNYGAYLTAIAAIDIVLDLVTWSLPLFVIKSLQMSKSNKLSVAGIFALGFFCIVSSAVRLYYCYQYNLISEGEVPLSEVSEIQTWNDVWAHIEACASIVTACLPAMAPLFTGMSPQRLYSSIRSFFSTRTDTSSTLYESHDSSMQKKSFSESAASNSHYDPTRYRAETYATYMPGDSDIEKQLPLPPATITVNRTFGSSFE